MSQEGQDSAARISEIKKRINEIAFAPLEEHGARFEGINEELNQALATVEGLTKQE